MDLTTVVAIASLLVSAGSLAYAHSALSVARDANRVGLHQTHLKMFDALLDFRELFVAMDLHPTREEIDRYYRRFVGPAHLYLPPSLLERSYSLYKHARELYDEIEHAESGHGGDKWKSINELQRLGGEELDQLIRDVAATVRIAWDAIPGQHAGVKVD